MPAISQTGQPLDEQAMREYLRDLGADTRYWYQAAETKAQVVLTVNGLFVTFLTASALASRADVVQATAAFGAETWAFLACMSLCMTLAILSAVTCLASRGLGRRKLQRLLGDYAVDPDKADTYAPEMTVFFYFLSALKAAPFIERLRTADQAFVVRALSSDIIDFAPYVVAKHHWVNRAFIMTGMTLGFFLCAGVSYVIRVHLAVLPPSPRPHGIGAHRFKAVIQAQSARYQSSNDRRLKLRSRTPLPVPRRRCRHSKHAVQEHKE